MAEHQAGHSQDDSLPPDAPAELPIPRLPRPPFWMVSIALIGIVLTWLPLAIVARARVSTSTEPRIQIAQDMAKQPKYREQETNYLFEDDRAARPHIPGTVAQNDLEDDWRYFDGFHRLADGKVEFLDGFPPQVEINPKLLARGQQRFNIYCYVCHGLDGSGRGPVNQRAVELQSRGVEGMTWTQAAQLTGDPIRVQPNGKIFNTITNGIRAMPSYGSQIPVADRWAIIAYVRALQFSQRAPLSVVPLDDRAKLTEH